MADKKLEVNNLTITFKTDNGLVQAVRDISFDLYEGETLCIVGESGSGKSVTSKAIMGILANNAIVEQGSIIYEGENLLDVSEEEFHKIRGHKIGMIFQDPLSSLNPIVKIGKQITEATLVNSNKLKRRYDDLISKENMQYKNAIARCSIKCNKEKNKFDLLKIDLNKKINNTTKDQEVAKCQAKIDDINVLYQDKIYTAKEELNVKLSSIYEEFVSTSESLEGEALAKAKANYKTQVAEVKAKHKSEITSLKQECATEVNNVKAELKSLLPSLNQKASEEISSCKKQIADAKVEYKSKVKVYNEELKANLPALKEALNKRKATAKVEIKEYVNQIRSEFEEEQSKLNNELKALYASRNEALKTNKPQKIDGKLVKSPVIEKYDAQIKELQNKIVESKYAYVDKTKITKAEAKRRALNIMKEVGIPMPEKRFKQYPFEFSGGMRQRIVIAIALTASPDVLICDEPTTALDVTIQAQILELINKLKRERNLSCIFITHDLGVVANMADRVAVMYAGKIVEYGTVEEIFYEPKHPYTWALLSSIPDVDSKERLEAIPGTPPDMIYPPVGDAFALRSKYAMEVDMKYQPPFFKVSDTHYAATWLLHPDAPKVEMPKIVSERIKNSLKEESSNE